MSVPLRPPNRHFDRTGDRRPALLTIIRDLPNGKPVRPLGQSGLRCEEPRRRPGVGTEIREAARQTVSREGPAVRIRLPPAESQSLAGLYLRGSRTPAFRAGFLAAFSARSAESRRARQYRTNLRQYLCRAIFQYRISGDAQSRQVVGLKSQASPNEVGLLWLRDAGGFCECGITLKQIRAQSADRARQAADGNAQAASPPSDRAAAVLR
jgi:hypothetical protein